MAMGGLRQSAVGDVLRLFEEGTIAGLTEGQLLDRFVSLADGSAFGALVDRHGPMVLGVCRRVLIDPNDVDDAFQATFLVLAKKASTIRDQSLLAHWLYGVAHRISVRARADAAKRRGREREGARSDDVSEEGGSLDALARCDLAALIQDEVARLPEKYRMPVVLCDLSGHTHEEAARRLAWPVGTVKGRQSRARDLLKKRLVQRGIAPSASLLILTMVRESSAGTVPTALAQTTIKAATLVATGQTAALGLISAHVVAMMQEGMTTMSFSTLKLTATSLLAASFVVGGAAVFAQVEGVSPATKPGTGTTSTIQARVKSSGPILSDKGPEVPGGSAKPPTKSLEQQLIEQSRISFETTKSHYEEGRITLDRLIAASSKLAEVEERVKPEAAQEHLERLKAILKREEAELGLGRGTIVNVNEIKTAVLETEFKLSEAKAIVTPLTVYTALQAELRRPPEPTRPVSAPVLAPPKHELPPIPAQVPKIMPGKRLSFEERKVVDAEYEYKKAVDDLRRGATSIDSVFKSATKLRDVQFQAESGPADRVRNIESHLKRLADIVQTEGLTDREVLRGNELMNLPQNRFGLGQMQIQPVSPFDAPGSRIPESLPQRDTSGPNQLPPPSSLPPDTTTTAFEQTRPEGTPILPQSPRDTGPDNDPLAPPTPTFPPMTHPSGGIPAGGSSGSGDAEAQNPLTQAALKSLSTTVSLNFAEPAALDTVISYLKDKSSDKDGKNGLSFYLDPLGLLESEKTKSSEVTIDLPNVSIRTGLKLVLSQLDLTYFIKDGVVIITNADGQHRLRVLFGAPDVLPPFDASEPMGGSVGMGGGGFGGAGGGMR